MLVQDEVVFALPNEVFQSFHCLTRFLRSFNRCRQRINTEVINHIQCCAFSVLPRLSLKDGGRIVKKPIVKRDEASGVFKRISNVISLWSPSVFFPVLDVPFGLWIVRHIAIIGSRKRRTRENSGCASD